jgi:1-deoxy-D-xylulose-5-phosphate synthase
VQDIGLQRLPVTFAVDRAGLVGDDGPTHHGAFDLSFLRVIPGMTVMAPSSQEELQRMLATALTLDGPAAVRYPRGLAAPFSPLPSIEPVPVGRGVVIREGTEVALVGIGTGVGMAREAAELLAAEGAAAPTVVDARFVKPLDTELLQRLAATHRRIVTVEENTLAGGFGSAVLEVLAGGAEVLRLGLPDMFVPHGDREQVLADVGLTARAIALAAGAASPALAPLTRVDEAAGARAP